ncbi:hypothetical protein EUGRSUZ_F03561 [Eucalyptus grandis]|uniref:Uncharacterized protein n=2 Tax=Eucalyptus grandis TaxID=71139 RepID=A0ACC3KP41_EUCGR|nr:hypothetical protein EUGRSUZ_F03561 [Eucalyptus grandis]
MDTGCLIILHGDEQGVFITIVEVEVKCMGSALDIPSSNVVSQLQSQQFEGLQITLIWCETIPVFFIRDGKPNPKSHVQENWRILDVLAHHPESLGMFTLLFDDTGIPQDERNMTGSGVNTYALINKARKAHYVKFHWKQTCGVKSLLEEEAIRVGGSNHSLATRDLYDSIAAGNYLEWKLFVQIMDTDYKDKFDFDPLDLAFCPSIVVPGVYYSDDKLLQVRIFSYSDAQTDRFAPNYLQLPSNAPKCAHHYSHHEEINYFPSRYDPVRHAERYPIPTAMLTGKREKENNFKQPGERYRSRAPDRQEQFIC